jgi:hypothetical protein
MKQVDGFSLSPMGQNFEARAKDTGELSRTLKSQGKPQARGRQINPIHFACRRD